MLKKEKVKSSEEYNNSLSKKIKEIDKKMTALDNTIDELYDLTERMLLNIGEII